MLDAISLVNEMTILIQYRRILWDENIVDHVCGGRINPVSSKINQRYRIKYYSPMYAEHIAVLIQHCPTLSNIVGYNTIRLSFTGIRCH